MTRRLLLGALAGALLLGLPYQARAVAITGTVKNVPYVIAYRPLNTHDHPYMGQMHLDFTNGIISGTYSDISVRPGSPLANTHNVSVSGGVSKTHVTLIIRQITFRGTASGQTMSGSTTIRGTMYEWHAQQGTPGSGK